MRLILFYRTFPQPVMAGEARLANDVIAQHLREARMPVIKMTLYYSLHNGYLRVLPFASLGLLVTWQFPRIPNQSSTAFLLAAAGVPWLALKFLLIKYGPAKMLTKTLGLSGIAMAFARECLQ